MCKLCAVLCARAFPAYGHKRPLDGREKTCKQIEKQIICVSHFSFFVLNVRLRGGRRPVQRPLSGAPGGPSRGSSWAEGGDFPNIRSRSSQIVCKVMCDCYVPSLCAKVMCKRIVFETNCF